MEDHAASVGKKPVDHDGADPRFGGGYGLEQAYGDHHAQAHGGEGHRAHLRGRPGENLFPAVSKDRVAREQTQTLLKRLFSGRASLLVNDMVEQGELDDEELRELQSILERAEKQKKNRRREPNESC